MLQIRLKLTNNRDGESNKPEKRIPQSDEEILRALSCFCRIQSALSCDKIIRLYERVKSTSDCLVDYDIEDHSVSSSPAAPTLYPTSDTCGSSSTSQYINPSLLTLDKDAQDHSTRTSFLTPSSDRSHSPLLSSTREPLNKSPSSELDREASGAFREQDPPHAATTPDHDFDSAFRELEEMGLLDHSSDVRVGPCDRTNSLDPSTRFPLGGNEGPPSETVDVSRNGPSTGQLWTPAPIFDRGEGVGQDPSPRLARNTPAGGSHELRGIDTANIEKDAHRESPNATPYDNCPQTPRASCASSGWSPGASYFTPDTSTVATPTTTMSQQSSAEATEGNQTSKRCPSERRSLKYQPTVEDAPGESERNAEVLSHDSDEFGDLSINAVLDDAHRFLGDTSGDHESSSSSITNAVGADPDTNSPAIASCRLESDNQHALLLAVGRVNCGNVE